MSQTEDLLLKIGKIYDVSILPQIKARPIPQGTLWPEFVASHGYSKLHYANFLHGVVDQNGTINVDIIENMVSAYNALAGLNGPAMNSLAAFYLEGNGYDGNTPNTNVISAVSQLNTTLTTLSTEKRFYYSLIGKNSTRAGSWDCMYTPDGGTAGEIAENKVQSLLGRPIDSLDGKEGFWAEPDSVITMKNTNFVVGDTIRVVGTFKVFTV